MRCWKHKFNKYYFIIYKIHSDHKDTCNKLQMGKVQGKVEVNVLNDSKVPTFRIKLFFVQLSQG